MKLLRPKECTLQLMVALLAAFQEAVLGQGTALHKTEESRI